MSNSTKKASWLEKICKSFVEMGKSDSAEKLGVVSLEASSKQPGWIYRAASISTSRFDLNSVLGRMESDPEQAHKSWEPRQEGLWNALTSNDTTDIAGKNWERKGSASRELCRLFCRKQTRWRILTDDPGSRLCDSMHHDRLRTILYSFKGVALKRMGRISRCRMKWRDISALPQALRLSILPWEQGFPPTVRAWSFS